MKRATSRSADKFSFARSNPSPSGIAMWMFTDAMRTPAASVRIEIPAGSVPAPT
jgi:hypothetical protein